MNWYQYFVILKVNINFILFSLARRGSWNSDTPHEVELKLYGMTLFGKFLPQFALRSFLFYTKIPQSIGWLKSTDSDTFYAVEESKSIRHFYISFFISTYLKLHLNLSILSLFASNLNLTCCSIFNNCKNFCSDKIICYERFINNRN